MTRRMGEIDRLTLDRDLPQEESRLGIGANPVDIDEASTFTLEAELVRLSSLIEERGRSRRKNQKVTNNEIKRRMKQAEKDRDKLSERGITAFDYLQSTKEIWGGL